MVSYTFKIKYIKIISTTLTTHNPKLCEIDNDILICFYNCPTNL